MEAIAEELGVKVSGRTSKDWATPEPDRLTP
jgi:hypothetical protein